MKNTIMHPTRGRLICKIWDNGGATIDRYTIAFKARRYNGRLFWPYLAASENPFHPLGFGQYGESQDGPLSQPDDKRVTFESLPEQVQKFIMQNI